MRKKPGFLVGGFILAIVLIFVFRLPIYYWANEKYQKAKEWNINPLIFVGLLFATFYHYYKGWIIIAKGLKLHDKSLLGKGILTNRIAWVIPYLYVLVFGKGYPWWVPTLTLTWITIGLVSFSLHIHNQKYVQKISNSRFSKLTETFSHLLHQNSPSTANEEVQKQ